MTNTKLGTTNAETETHLKLAGALNVITDLFSERYPHLPAQERYELFNKSLGELCNTLGIDLDMFDNFQRGDITFEDYEDLRQVDKGEKDETVNVVMVADELKELYFLNDSMFMDDPNSIPKFTDGTRIRPQDLADMNMNGLQRIAELIGIELGE